MAFTRVTINRIQKLKAKRSRDVSPPPNDSPQVKKEVAINSQLTKLLLPEFIGLIPTIPKVLYDTTTIMKVVSEVTNFIVAAVDIQNSEDINVAFLVQWSTKFLQLPPIIKNYG
jgi:hypothetical protein